MPSATIVPEPIATSMTREPQALFTVPMSTPWSSVQVSGGSTCSIGRSGNTNVVLLVDLTVVPLVTQARRVRAVRMPATPVTGLRYADATDVRRGGHRKSAGFEARYGRLFRRSRTPAACGERRIVAPVSALPPSLDGNRGPGARAAALAASWYTRRLGRAYALWVWQLLADAARVGVIRDGQPEVWAAGAVIAVARGSGFGTGGALTAQEVADDFDVTLGSLAVTERELARALNLAHYAL
jgi:hypothetical protein